MPEIYGNLSDQDMMNEMLKDSKYCIHSLSIILGESASVPLREKLVNEINSCFDEHFRLTDMAVKKTWYQPSLPPNQQLQQELTAISTQPSK